ncbi:HNH endonuclease [Enterobacter ludwigii]|uniref:HNH endonuclease n=1 Tax=Enterobacter ludwigii TaxID=299767 RepID=UPI00397616D3
MTQKAWSFKAVDQDDLRYHGNTGYHDDPTKLYRYDNFVGNYTNVKEGDIAIITDREALLGIAIIESIPSQPYIKKRNKCPTKNCTPKKINFRKTKQLKWRCSNGCEFHEPLIEHIDATEFIAHYGTSYKELYGISMDSLKTMTPRFNVQGSIQEVDIEWARNLLKIKDINLLPTEADTIEKPLDATDGRLAVIRQIKQRRGQRKFREKLLVKHEKCSVTGCAIVDILEAAHITPYRNDSHNDISNGLLLRSDIHTLYDLNLFAIHPINLTIHFAPVLLESEYSAYHHKRVNIKHKLNNCALTERWQLFSNMHGFESQ